MTEGMNDFERRLADELRAWTDAAPRSADFAEEARFLAASRSRPRRPWLAPLLVVSTSVAAATVALAIISLAPIAKGPAASDAPSPAAEDTPAPSAVPTGPEQTPAPTTVASPTTEPGPTDWPVVVLPKPSGVDTRAEDVYSHERLGFTAVGWKASGDGVTRPAAWWSVDGSEWSEAEVALGSTDAYQLGPILDLGDRLISFATGSLGESGLDFGTILFASDDGQRWEPLADGRAPEGGTVRDIAMGGPGYIAVGSAHSPLPEQQGAMVWTSDDGVTWSPVPDTDGLGPGVLSYGYVDAVASDGSVLVAVGARWDDQMTAHPGVWRSTDGLRWEEVASEAGVEEFPSSIAASADGFVMGGVASGGGPNVPVAWRSVDGRSWTSADVEPGQGGAMVDIAVGQGGMVGVGDGVQGAGAWRSPDGSVWQAFELTISAAAQQPSAWRIASASEGFVVVGWARIGPGAERVALVWVGD